MSAAERTYTLDEIKEMRAVFGSDMIQKHDPASTVSNWVGAHGPFGLFNIGADRPEMFSTMSRPTDLSNVIPLFPSRNTNERMAIMTGQTETEGTRAADICSEGPTPGKLKRCRINVVWGTLKVDGRVERLTSFGNRLDYSDLDKNFLNLQAINNRLLPDFLSPQNVNTDAGKMFFEMSAEIERSYSILDIAGQNGNTSDAAHYADWIEQYDGLNRWIRTGYTDAGGTACAALDSLVITHNAPIGSNGTNGQTFIANMMAAWRSAKQRASDVGMGDVQFAIVAHPNASWGLYDQWACAYNSDRCTGSAGNPVNQDALFVMNFKQQLMNGQYLLIDNDRAPILWSHGMQWDGVSNNRWNTDIYVVPISWRGRPLLYRQFFPLNNAEAQEWMAGVPAAGSLIRITNGGLYALGGRTTNGFCAKPEIISRTRLILDTPFLAARVNDVQIDSVVVGFDPFVGMTNYRNGGVSTNAS